MLFARPATDLTKDIQLPDNFSLTGIMAFMQDWNIHAHQESNY